MDSRGVFGFYNKPKNELIEAQREPMLIPDLRRIIQLSVGNDFCLALDEEGIGFFLGQWRKVNLSVALWSVIT